MSKNGLFLLTPTSITVAGGSGSISPNGSVSFSGCYSISLNNVFKVDYENFMIVCSHDTTTSATGPMQFKLRSGTTDSSSGYSTQELLVFTSTLSRIRQNTSVGYIAYFAYETCGFVANVFAPNVAGPTILRSDSQSYDSSAPTINLSKHVISHSVAGAYDGFTITTGTAFAALDGKIAVYGLRN